MREYVLETPCVILFRREPHNAFAIQVHFEGSHLGDQYVNAHVPFVIFNQQRIGDVLLNDALLVVGKLPNVVDQKDLSPTTQVSWLTNPNCFFIRFGELLDELLVLVRQYERCRAEGVDGTEHRLKPSYKHNSYSHFLQHST